VPVFRQQRPLEFLGNHQQVVEQIPTISPQIHTHVSNNTVQSSSHVMNTMHAAFQAQFGGSKINASVVPNNRFQTLMKEQGRPRVRLHQPMDGCQSELGRTHRMTHTFLLRNAILPPLEIAEKACSMSLEDVVWRRSSRDWTANTTTQDII
jgi:hypothetical protein